MSKFYVVVGTRVEYLMGSKGKKKDIGFLKWVWLGILGKRVGIKWHPQQEKP